MKKDSNINRQNNIPIWIVLVAAFILLIPLLAMQFTDEVDWGLADFIIIGALIIGFGTLYELVARKLGSTRNRVVLGIVLAVTLLLIWIELAVGIFGTPFSGQ